MKRRPKTDAAAAEAICEALTRPTMRFVAVKSAESQADLSLHRTRELLVKQRTQLINMVRGHWPSSASRCRARKPARLVPVALANKAARIVWALMVKGGVYRATAPAMVAAV